MTATRPRTRGSAGGAMVTGPAAGALVPRTQTDGRPEAPRREAQFGSGRAAELKFVTSGTTHRSVGN